MIETHIYDLEVQINQRTHDEFKVGLKMLALFLLPTPGLVNYYYNHFGFGLIREDTFKSNSLNINNNLSN